MSKNNTKTSTKAKVAFVTFGETEVEGLKLADGTYALTCVQANQLIKFSTSTQNVAKLAKDALRGKSRLIPENKLENVFVKVATELTNNPQWTMTIEQFEDLVKVYARRGNKNAIDFALATIGLSIRQRFADAFNEKFEREEREEWVKNRHEGKQVRRTLTDAVQSYIDTNPDLTDGKKKWLYKNVTDKINRAIFDRSAKNLREQWEVDNPRDHMTSDELRWVGQAEDLTQRIIDNDCLDPIDAVEIAIERLLLPKVDR